MGELALFYRRSRALLTVFTEWAPFVLVSGLALALAAGLGATPRLRVIRNLLMTGVLLRMIGVLLRYAMVYDVYSGSGDAVEYFEAGRVIADHFRSLDFSIIGSGMWGDQEWGTQAIRYACGLVLAVVGPSAVGAFLVFSLAAFVGLTCIAVAFGRASRVDSMRPAAWLLFLWPTLWFWPSSIGKEATLLLAVGLVTVGYVGRAERIHWLPLITGFALTIAVRPHLAGVLAVSMCVAEWAARGWTVQRLAQAVAATALAVWLLTSSLNLLGLSNADFGTMQAYALDAAEHTHQGGSAIERTDSSITAVPMAFVNLLARPFITEAHNPMAILSSVEMMAFWAIVAYNPRRVWSTLRFWRNNRLIRLAVPFSVLYIVMIGMTFQNLGIIARQRTLVMPALLLILAVPAGGAGRPEYRKVAHTRRVWRTRRPSHAAVRP